MPRRSPRDGLERGERRRDARTSRPARPADAAGERRRQRHGLAARAVHLPVAGERAGSAHRSIPTGASPPSAREPGQLLALEELERRAAAGRDVRHGVELAGAARARPPSRRRRRPWCPSTRASASAIGERALRERRRSRRCPSGRSRATVCARRRSRRRTACAVAGPMSTPSRSAGNSSAAHDLASWRRPRACRPRDGRPAAAPPRPSRVARSSVSRASAELVAPRRASCRPASPARAGTCTPSRRRCRTPARGRAGSRCTPILSDTFAPPRTATNGFSGSCEQLPRAPRSPSQEQARRRARLKCIAHAVRSRRARGARRRTRRSRRRRRAARAPRERSVVLLLLGVEAQVLEQQRPRRRLSRVDQRARCRRRRSRARAGPRAERARARLRRDRLEREASDRACPSAGRGATRGSTRAAVLEQPADRRQRRLDARRVGDARRFVERHVEVDADEDALARDVEVLERPHDGRRSRRLRPTSTRDVEHAVREAPLVVVPGEDLARSSRR